MITSGKRLRKKRTVKKFKARKKIWTVNLSNGAFMKLRLVLWIPTATGKIYLLSLASGKSKRQLNDWMNKRTRKKQVQKLSSNLTNNLSYFLLLRVMHQIHAWCDQLIPGDMVVFNCESAKPEKQFRAWGKWLTTKDSKCKWISNPEFLSFYFYKHMNLE